MTEPIADVVWFYNQRAGAENLIKEANNDCGLAAHPSKRFDMNGNLFQMAMLAYNLNVWMQLFHREPRSRCGVPPAYDAGHRPAAFPVHCRQDLDACRPHGHPLQRLLPGTGHVRPPDEPAPPDHSRRHRLATGRRRSLRLNPADGPFESVHRILCTDSKLYESQGLAAWFR